MAITEPGLQQYAQRMRGSQWSSATPSPLDAGQGSGCPATWGDFVISFPDEAACVAYLEELRWPRGFSCPHCGGDGWRTACARWACGGCGRRVSVTAGTVFAGTRTPLRSWFVAAWTLTGTRPVSASRLQRMLGLGSYQTAWAIGHRLRAAMPQTQRLTGVVEVEAARLPITTFETATVGIAAETPSSGDRAVGQIRVCGLPNTEAASLAAFVVEVVEPAATVLTGGSLPPPATQRIGRLLAAWLPRSVTLPHLPAYLDAFAFAVNHRQAPHGWRFRRLLAQGVHTPPVRVMPSGCTEMERKTEQFLPIQPAIR